MQGHREHLPFIPFLSGRGEGVINETTPLTDLARLILAMRFQELPLRFAQRQLTRHSMSACLHEKMRQLHFQVEQNGLTRLPPGLRYFLHTLHTLEFCHLQSVAPTAYSQSQRGLLKAPYANLPVLLASNIRVKYPIRASQITLQPSIQLINPLLPA